MKNTLIICLLLICCSLPVLAQKKNRFDRPRFGIGVSGSMLVVPLSGVMDVGSGNETIVDGRMFPSEPKYQIKDSTALMWGLYAHGTFVLPIYQQQYWSTGIELSAGLGRHTSIRAAEGLSSVVLDFPQYVYFRYSGTKIDFSVLAGYKYTYAPLSMHMLLTGLEFHTSEESIIRFYGSVFSNKYYRYYTDGRTEEQFRVAEYGVSYVAFF